MLWCDDLSSYETCDVNISLLNHGVKVMTM